MSGIVCINKLDAAGNPAGGYVDGIGISIQWQDGPLGRGADRKEPNGAFVEDVIEAALRRITWYQIMCGGRYGCRENSEAIEHLQRALAVMHRRTLRREIEGIEGTHSEDAISE